MAYNGWTNYETWNVALWMDNDQGTYSLQQEWAESAWDDHKPDLEDAKRQLADCLKDFVEENNPLGSEASMYSDLLGAALSEVDWEEIAENWLDEIDKEAPEPPEPDLEEVPDVG